MEKVNTIIIKAMWLLKQDSENRKEVISSWVKYPGALDSGMTYEVVSPDNINLNFSLLSDLGTARL